MWNGWQEDQELPGNVMPGRSLELGGFVLGTSKPDGGGEISAGLFLQIVSTYHYWEAHWELSDDVVGRCVPKKMAEGFRGTDVRKIGTSN